MLIDEKMVEIYKPCTSYNIREYGVLDGVSVCYNDIYTNKTVNKKERNDESLVFEINYCKEGRFECTLKDGNTTYMEPGDFSINPKKNSPNISVFPINYYCGITIYIDIAKIDEDLLFIQKLLGINFLDILTELCTDDKLFIKRATPEIQHIFQEIYYVPEDMLSAYMVIKIQELFLYLNTVKNNMLFDITKEYFNLSNIIAVKNIHDYIIKNIHNSYTHEQLATLFSINQTYMKKCYKSVYGETIYTTIKKQKLGRAAMLLETTSISIIDIALEVGYSNHSQFSTAFKKMYNISPIRYRKKCRIDKKKHIDKELSI